MKPVPSRPPKGNKHGPSILSERRRVYENGKQLINASTAGNVSSCVDPAKKENTEVVPDLKELLDGLLYLKRKKYPKQNAMKKKLDLVEYSFSCLGTLKEILPVPYPSLFAHVERALTQSVYHQISNIPYFALLPEFEQKEETLLASDKEWGQRYKEASLRYKNLLETYESDKTEAARLGKALKEAKREEADMQLHVQGLKDTQEDALKHLDHLQERVRKALRERDRQNITLFDARKAHKAVVKELKVARDTLAATGAESKETMVSAEVVEEVEDDIGDMNEKIATWTSKLASLKDRHQISKEKYRNLIVEEERLQNETAVMMEQHAIFRRSFTPRPDWDRLVEETPELAQALRMEKFVDLMLHIKDPQDLTHHRYYESDSDSSEYDSEDPIESRYLDGDEGDEGLNTEVSKLTSLLARRQRAREKASKRARQFHKVADLRERKTHQAHHIHHLHKEHRLRHIESRRKARINKRLTNAKLQSQQQTHDIALEGLNNSSEIHTTKYLAKVLCDVAEVTRVGIGVTRDMEGMSRDLGLGTLREMKDLAKKQLDDVQASYREAKLHRDKDRLKSHRTGTHGGGVPMYSYPPLGMDKDVPAYLRTLVPVMRKTFGKAKLEKLIELVWDERVAMRLRMEGKLATPVNGEEYEGPVRHYYAHYGRMQPLPESMLPPDATFADFLAWHLVGDYGRVKMAEYGFNILAACEEHIDDADVELFYLCLTGAMPEFVYDDSVNMMSLFAELMTRIDIANAKAHNFVGVTLHVHELDLKRNLRLFFPRKTETELKRLDGAVDKILSRDDGFINHSAMFAESALGTQNAFIEELRDQHLRAIRKSMIDLEKELCAIGNSRHGGAQDALVRDIRNVLLRCSGSSDVKVDEHVRNGLGVKSQSDVHWDVHVPIKSFLQGLYLKGYRHELGYTDDFEVELAAIKVGKGKPTSTLLEETAQKKNYYQAKRDAEEEDMKEKDSVEDGSDVKE